MANCGKKGKHQSERNEGRNFDQSEVKEKVLIETTAHCVSAVLLSK